MTMDVKNFYLNTPMARHEYLWLCMGDIPDNVQKRYNLHDKAFTNGYVHVKTQKGMFGLPQAG